MKKLIVMMVFMALGSVTALHAQREMIYVGTFTERGSEGIYVFELDRGNLELKQLQTISTYESPSFLAPDPEGKFLYCVNRAGMPGSKNKEFGSLSAYKIDQSTGKLSVLNSVSSQGISPCHISTDHKGKFVFVSHYGSGNLTAFSIRNDGGLGELTANIQHIGSSVNPQRQEKPHLHSAQPSPDNQLVVSADLGIDKLMLYKLDQQKGTLENFRHSEVSTIPGGGPRHFTFHPSGKYLYLAEEMGSAVTAFVFDKNTGALTRISRHSTLPEDYSGSNSVADIHTSPDGSYLFVSNRGHNSLAIFRVDTQTGKLEPTGHQSVMGDWPRNFLVDSRGDFIIVANRRTDQLVLFRFDATTGKLSPTGKEYKVPSAVCIKQLQLD